MKQQCSVSIVYGSWLILIAGLLFWMFRGEYFQAFSWVIFIGIFLWLYVRFFPRLSRYLGYGSVEDQPANDIKQVKTEVILYTGAGCPFCPVVKKRLSELSSKMGFKLTEIDILLKPDLTIKKGIKALPVVEVGHAVWTGNATSQQLAEFIQNNSTAN